MISKMTDREIRNIAVNFRVAIEKARDDGAFNNVCSLMFGRFPVGCCGNTSDILAEYLLKQYGIETIYVWGWKEDQSHGWLVVKDERVRIPQMPRMQNVYPDEISALIKRYGGDCVGYQYEDRDCEEKYYEAIRYEPEDIENGLIIDITSDWIGGDRIYVAHMNDFYRNIDFEEAHDQLPGYLSSEKVQLLEIVEKHLG